MSPWDTDLFCIWRSSSRGQGHRSQTGRTFYFHIVKLQSAVTPVL